MLAVLVLGIIIFGWMRSEMNRKAAQQAGGNTTAAPQVRVESRFESPSEQEALGLVKEALALRDVEQVERYFRLGSAKPEEIVAFLDNLTTLDGEITGYQWLSSMDANGLLIDGVLVNSQLNGAPRNRLALLTPDDRGNWKIDFAAFARKVDPPWQELLERHASAGMVRVMVARDSYYNGVFSDEGEWLSFGMASPDIQQIFVGYCRRSSPQAAALEKIMNRVDEPVGAGRHIKRATLAISRPAGAEPQQLEITRVLAEDWVVSDKSFDDSTPITVF